MCGILGVWFRDDQRRVDANWLERVNSSMYHRGPDEGGIYVDGNLGLGHRRLSIIDVSSGQQPMHSPDGNITLVFNGEIYNYKQLRKDLEQQGHTFSTHSDTEVLLRLFVQEGARCVDKLNGMFAFAAWDARRRELFLARDRIGIKPLYYSVSPAGFVFASEIKALLKTGLVDAAINADAIDSFLTLGWVPAPQTLFRNIHKLDPGHTAVVREAHDMRCTRYWSVDYTKPLQLSQEELQTAFHQEMLRAVERHMVSDVPVGAFLSGGIDSSALVACMHHVGEKRPMTFSVAYPDDPETSEHTYARLVAKAFQTEHHEFLLKPIDFFESIEKLLEHCEEPIDEPAGIALYELSALARKHVKVVLTGEGMDELMGGYPLYRKMLTLNRVYPAVRALGGSHVADFVERFVTSETALKYLDWIAQPLETRYQSVNCRLTARIKKRMYPHWNGAGTTPLDRYFSAILTRYPGASPLQKMSAVDIAGWMPDCLLLRSDKMSMAASIELRVPFLDHSFVELCSALPDNVKIRSNVQKYLLRTAMTGILPSEVLTRPKRGFPVPIAKWFGAQLLQPLRDVLCDARTRERGYVSTSYVDHILKRHADGVEDNSIRLFYFLVLEMWHRKYIDHATHNQH